MKNPERDAFLRELLRHFAGNGTAGLHEMMRSGSPELACGAAHLLLDGHKFGAWRPRPGDLKLARKIVAKSEPVVESKREAKPMAKEMQPLKWSDLGSPAEPAHKTIPSAKANDTLPLLRRALHVHRHMLVVLTDPSSSPRARVAAVQDWVAAMDATGMQPAIDDDFRDLLICAARAIAKEKSHVA